VVTDDAALVLHNRERGRKVWWGPRKARRGAASGSPSGLTVVSWGRSGREARALASEADGPIPGRMGEVAACLSVGEKEQGGKGERDDGRRLLWRLGGAGGEERGRGSGVRRRVEGKAGKREGAPSVVGGGLGRRHRPPARARLTDGTGQRLCAGVSERK
jgi:hypothetical protein